MKFLVLISVFAAAYAAGQPSIHTTRSRTKLGGGGKAVNSAGTAAQLGKTIVLFEVGGVPGNECLTFRNNGQSTPLLNTMYLLITLLQARLLMPLASMKLQTDN